VEIKKEEDDQLIGTGPKDKLNPDGLLPCDFPDWDPFMCRDTNCHYCRTRNLYTEVQKDTKK
jgi:hypothetical protein